MVDAKRAFSPCRWTRERELPPANSASDAGERVAEIVLGMDRPAAGRWRPEII
jgi:hypothetical protein